MNKISITIDVNKIDKTRLQTRIIKTKENTGYSAKEMKLEVIPLKERKVLASSMEDSSKPWELVKVGFVVEAPTKEEKANKTKTNIVGDATMFVEKNAVPSFDRDSTGKPVGQPVTEDVNPEDIPW